MNLAWNGEGCCTLDKLRPRGRLTWNARFEPIFVALPLPAGRVVAREGV